MRCANRSDVQVCISDNHSDESIESALESLANFRGNIVFVRQESRLPLDDHMLAVTKLANGEYVFFLGDDDVIMSNIDKCINCIENKRPDIIFLGAVTVDKDGFRIREVCADRDYEVTDANLAYRELSQYAAFGALIVKRELLREDYFRMFFGTLHAYGCFWPALQNKHAAGIPTLVAVLGGCNVGLRASTKSYDPMYLSVALEKSMTWCDISASLLIGDHSKRAIAEWRDDHRRRMLRFRQFITFKLKNVSSRELAAFYFENGARGIVLGVLSLTVPHNVVRFAAQCWKSGRARRTNRNRQIVAR